MALNDVTPSAVFGTNSGIYTGNALPSAITNSANKVIVIPLASAHAKAILSTIKLINPTLTEGDYDSASDILALINACAYAYSILNSKPSDLRKFDCSYLGKSLDDGGFESSKLFITRQVSLALYEENTTLTDNYNPSVNTLT
jgi:hypothetical protein